MLVYFYIFLGGGAGSVGRFLVSEFAGKFSNTFFPSGTLIVNLLGCFLMGILFEIFEIYFVAVELRIMLTVGFLGGFTTFSSFALENVNFLRDGEFRALVFNIFTQNILGFFLLIAGIFLVRICIKFFIR